MHNAGDLGLIPGLGRSPGEGNGYPLQYSCLENSMGRGTWWATVHGVTKSWTWLSNQHTHTHTHTHTCPLPLWGSRTRRLHCLCCVPHPDPVCQGDVLGQAWTRANRSRWKTEGLLSAYTNCIFLKYPYLIFLTFWWMYKWDMKKIDLTFS